MCKIGEATYEKLDIQSGDVVLVKGVTSYDDQERLAELFPGVRFILSNHDVEFEALDESDKQNT